jgi:hypothetical protein
VENCDIVDSSGFGFVFIAEGDEGGRALGANLMMFCG